MIGFLLHPNLRNPTNKDYKKAHIMAWALLIIVIFIILYDAYFFIKHPEDVNKNITNVVGHLFFLSNVLFLRLSRNIKPAMISLVISSLFPTAYSVYYTGGIYSVDLSFLYLTALGTFVFIDALWGAIISLLVAMYVLVLYYLESSIEPNQPNLFKQYVVTNNSTHYVFTWFFALLLMAILLYAFSRVLEKVNLQLDAMNRDRIELLEQRVKQKTEEISQLRSSLARDFHDEMGNKLASINILSQSVAYMLSNNERNPEAFELLDTIGQRSKELFDGTKDFIWSIDFKSDYVFELFVYLREFGEQFFNGMDISFHSATNSTSQDSAILKSTAGRQVVLVSKEIMTNAARHAHCNAVYFSVMVKDKSLHITIKDDGIGFDLNKTTRRGLNNIEKRLKQIDASWGIKSAAHGTEFSITIPLEVLS